MLPRRQVSRRNPTTKSSLRSKHRRSSTLEVLETRALFTGSPHVLALSAGNAAIYDGDQLQLTASIDPNTPVSQVKFYLDNGDGLFNASSDTLLGTASSGASNQWSLANIPTHGSTPISVGHHLFFAQASDSSNTLSNSIGMPADIVSATPTVEPIDNDQIIAGRRFVMTAKADLPPTASHVGTMSYALTFVSDANHASAPSGYSFDSSTGTMLWDTTSGQVSTAPYHFRATATFDDGTTQVSSAARDVYLTVVSGPQYLTTATDPNAPSVGPFNSTTPVFYNYQSSPAAGTGTSISVNIDPATGAGSQTASGNVVTTLVYNTATTPYPIIEADVPVSWLSNTSAVYLSAQAGILDHAGTSTLVSSDLVYYTMAGVNTGQTQYFHLALPVDASSLATGQYKVNVHLNFLNSSGGTIASQNFGSSGGFQNASVAIVNRSASATGNRWAIDGIDQLVPYTDGVLLVHGDGTTQWFSKNSTTGLYDGGMQVVTVGSSSRFHWAAHDGAYEEFDMTTGNLLVKADMLGNQIVYDYYTSSDTGTGVWVGALKSITDPSQRQQTFRYDSNGSLQYTTDFAGRVTTLVYTSGRLTSVTKADGSQQTFTYDSTTGLLASRSNAIGETTYYEYDNLNRLTRTINPDGSFAVLQSSDTSSVAHRVVVSNSGGSPVYLGSSIAVAAPLLAWNIDNFGPGIASNTFMGAMGRVVDSSGNILHYTTDASGKVSSVTQPVLGSSTAQWEQGPSTFTLHNVQTGLLAIKIEPSPTGTGIVGTAYGYESNFNLTSLYKNDATTPAETWNYTPSSGTNPYNELYSYTQNDITGHSDSRTTNYSYYTNGLLQTKTDALLGQTSYTYTDNLTLGIPAGLIQTITDPNGNVTHYDYYSASDSQSDLGVDVFGESGKVKQITRAYGTTDAATTQFKYDQYGNLVQVTEPGNRVTTFGYDLFGRLTQAQQRGFASSQTAGPTWSYSYNTLGELTQSTDADGNRTLYLYNLRDQVSAVIAPAPSGDGQLPGPETIYIYTPTRHIDTTIDPLGHWTHYTYDARNELTSVAESSPTTGLIDSGSPLTQYSYNAAGYLATVTDPNGNGVAHYDYDALGNLSDIRSLDSTGASNNHQSNGLLHSFSYNGFGEILSDSVPLSAGVLSTTDYVYDKLGRQQYVYPSDPTTGTPTDQVNPSTTDYYFYDYDAGGRLVGITTPPADSSHTAQTTTYAYDHQDRLTQIVQPIPTTGTSHPTTQYTYDTNYLYAKMTDPSGNVTTWNYNNFGQLDTEVSQGYDPNTSSLTTFGTRSFLYDGNGNLTQYTDRLGRVNQYVYDALGELTAEKWFDSSTLTRTLSYQYDLDGNLTSASDPTASYNYSYDKLGRRTSTDNTLAGWTTVVSLTNQYDLNGNRTQLSATVGSTADFVNQYTYDNLNQLIGLKQTSVSGGNSVAFKQVGMSYNDAGQLTNLNRFNSLVSDPTDATGALATSAYTYDKAGRLTGLVNTPSVGSAITQSWSYDALNRVTNYSNSSDANSTTYQYDNVNQLTSATQGSTINYSYDANGNRTAGNGLTSTPGPGNRLASDGTYNYTYDAEGNLIRRVNISTNDQLDFTYDHRNRLVDIKESNGNTSQPLFDLAYAYDVFDRLVSRTQTNYQYSDGGEGNSGTTVTSTVQVEKRVYDGDHVVLDYLSQSGGSFNLEHRYLYGSAVDQVLAQENADGSVLWMLTDNLGTVRDLVNSSGQVVQHYLYDAYGQITSGNTSVTRYLYTGRDFDATTGLQYNRERWYDSHTGRFLSEDPTLFADGPNPFIYAHNSPTNFRDPTGLWGDGGEGNDGGSGGTGGNGSQNQPSQWYDDQDDDESEGDAIESKLTSDTSGENGDGSSDDPSDTQAASGTAWKDKQAKTITMTASGGDNPTDDQFWKALKAVRKLYQGDDSTALGDIIQIRENGADNALLAALDHYFNAKLYVENGWLPGLNFAGAIIANGGYSMMKGFGIPVPQDRATQSPSDVSLLQWMAGNWGAADGLMSR